MISQYFLLPCDIKVVDYETAKNIEFRLKNSNNLIFNLVNLYVLNSKKELKFLETINLNDKRLLQELENKYLNLNKRLKKIYFTNNFSSNLLEGNTPK